MNYATQARAEHLTRIRVATHWHPAAMHQAHGQEGVRCLPGPEPGRGSGTQINVRPDRMERSQEEVPVKISVEGKIIPPTLPKWQGSALAERL